MGRSRNWPPQVKPHKGRDRVWWGDRYWDLGPAGSPQSRAKYARLLELWSVDPDAVLLDPDDYLCAELFRDWLASPHAPTGDGLDMAKRTARAFSVLHGELPCSELTALIVESWLHTLCKFTKPSGAPKYSRMTVTRYLATLKRAARWGAKSQRVKLEVCQLIELANVPKGWGRRSKKVLAADPALVAKVLPFLTPPVRAIAELQILTGSRQGGLIRLRPRDIYRTGKQELPGLGVVDLDVAGVWVGIPVSHKKEWRDKPRWVVLGPRAQAVIEPFLQGDPESYCFRPEESVRALRERQRQDRASRGGGSGGNRKPRVSQPKSKPREHYTTAGYRQAIRRACVRAGVAVINPHQIRHLFAAQIRDSHGIEDAQAMLGHDSPDMTKHYAKRSFERAARVARESG